MADSLSPPSGTTHHRVRKLLETYMDTAGLSLTGPAVERPSYKLPPDVELSKSGRYRISDERLSPGLATLSRIEDVAAAAAGVEFRCSRQRLSLRGERHLSGEMIRRILEQQKATDRLMTADKISFKSPPVLIARDRGSSSSLGHTLLWGEKISSFLVGGEHRCCLPQILNSVLDSVSLPAINQVCDELQIYCSTCTLEQLEMLKINKIIPITAAQCGLITKSDAERVCSVLLDRNPPRASLSSFRAKSSPFSFNVMHECFGRSYGIVLPEAYTSGDAKCIECLECEGLFSPQKFVCHAHHNLENRTCHWGFDSYHWKAYLQLSDSYSEEEKVKFESVLKDFKGRYSGGVSSLKRKEVLEESHKEEVCSKKSRTGGDNSLTGNSSSSPYNIYNLYNSWAAVVAKGYSPNPAPWTTAFKDNKIHSHHPMLGFAASYHHHPHHHNSLGRNRNYHISQQQQQQISLTLSKTQSQESSNHENEEENESLSVVKSSQSESLSESKKKEDNKNHCTTLAEDINSVREALQGASPIAKERTLKVLERLTERLAQTESERDIALENYEDLQRRYRITEDELIKKRGELRELLQQDTKDHRSSITLELLQERQLSTHLPKNELKSPSRLLEERSSSNLRKLPSPSCLNTKYKGAKDSEVLRERLISMEAELRTLREELLTHRSSEEESKSDIKTEIFV